MSQEETQSGQQQQQPAQQQQQPASGASQGNDPGPVPYTRFKQVNEALAEAKARIVQLEGEHRTTASQLGERDKELAGERARAARLDVAIRKGVPAEFVDRLKGDTVEALEQDADALLPLLKRKGPGVPPGGGGGSQQLIDLATMTPAQIREARARGLLNQQ